MANAQQSWDGAEQVQVQVPNTVEVSQGAGTTSVVPIPAGVEIEASDHQTNFMLNANASDVANYAREGNDLVITMHNGGVVRIKSFLSHGPDFNHVVFVGGDQVQPADVSAALAPTGDNSAAEAPVVVGSQEQDSSSGGGGGGGSLWSILGTLVVGALGIRSLNGSSAAATSPTTPTVTANDSDANGQINAAGTAAPGDKITVTWPDSTTATLTAGPDGSWSTESPTVQTSGAVSVVATDASGNTSQASVNYKDTTKPLAPVVTAAVDSDGDNKIDASGTAEPGSKVTVIWPDQTSATTTAGQDGKWSIESSTAQQPGAITVTATDAAGNVSNPATGTYNPNPTQTAQVTMLVNDGTDHAGPVSDAVLNDGSSGSHTIADTTPRVVGTLSAPLTSDEQLVVLRDNQVMGTATVTGTDWSYLDTGLTVGKSYVYTVQVQDAAGHAGAVSDGFTVQAVAASTDVPALSGVVGTSGADAATLLTDTVADGSSHTNPFSINGGGGNDTIALTSNGGHTRLVYSVVSNSTDATGGNGSDTVTGFHLGLASGTNADSDADVIALSNKLLSAADASTNLSKYVHAAATDDGNGTVISIDRTGSGTFATLVTLTDVKYTDSLLTDLISNQQIVVGAASTVTPKITFALDDAGPDQGLVAPDGITNDSTPTLMGTLSAALMTGQVVEVLRDGTAIGTATVDGANWSFTDSGLTDGKTYAYTAQVQNADGEAGTASTAFNLSYDATAPTATATIASFTDDVGAVTGNVTLSRSVTDDMAPLLNGTLSGTLGTNDVVTIYRDGTLLGPAKVTGSSWTYQDTGLTDGKSYSYVARVEDLAGNHSTDSSPFVIDADATPLTHTAQITGANDDSSVPGVLIPVDSSGYISDGTPQLTGTLSAALSSGEYVAIYRGNDLIGSATATGTTWTFTDSSAQNLKDGTYTYTARVEDGANHYSETSPVFTLNVASTPIPVDSSGDTINSSSFTTPGGVHNIVSGAGNDTFTLNTGDGHVKLDYTVLSTTDATGGNGSDTVTGFHVGNVATDSDADIIDLSALLPSTVTIDTSNIASYLKATASASGSDTVIAINPTGSSTVQFSNILTLTGVKTTLEDLMNNHQIVV